MVRWRLQRSHRAGKLNGAEASSSKRAFSSLHVEKTIPLQEGLTAQQLRLETGEDALELLWQGTLWGRDLRRLSARLREERDQIASVLGSRSSASSLLKAVFFDIETLGFRGCPLFLIGAMLWREGELQIHQFFAPTLRGERAVLVAFLQCLSEGAWLISFNGRAFDVPFVEDRLRAHRLPSLGERFHLDLLPLSRRCWGNILPNCRLQTLEAFLCGYRRPDDLPGSLVPSAYRAYQRDRNPETIFPVIQHNVQDLITLGELLLQLVNPAQRTRS
ncbi:MAG: hypothetical protein KatS3mg115_0894 [Candidatus Poribacteria bacterium]|nr:MAG: hypothetical protein KatS3mg115_0894 [Candidatus Poribacteria bacterium]